MLSNPMPYIYTALRPDQPTVKVGALLAAPFGRRVQQAEPLQITLTFTLDRLLATSHSDCALSIARPAPDDAAMRRAALPTNTGRP